MSDASKKFTLEIETEADLKALQALKAELESVRKEGAKPAAGGAPADALRRQSLEAERLLQQATKQEAAGQAEAAAHTRQLAEEIRLAVTYQRQFGVSEQQALHEARELLAAERQIAQAKAASARAAAEQAAAEATRDTVVRRIEKLTGFGKDSRIGQVADKLGLGLRGGLIAGGIAAAVTAVYKYMHAAHEASEEMRHMKVESADMEHALASAVKLDPDSAIAAAHETLHGIDKEMEDLAHKWAGAKAGNRLMEALGIEGDSSVLAELQHRQTETIRLEHEAAKATIERKQIGVDAAAAVLAGHTREAEALQRVADFKQKQAQIDQQFKPTMELGREERVKREAEWMERRRQAQQEFEDNEAVIARRAAEADGTASAEAMQQAHAAQMRANEEERAAEAAERINKLGAELLKIRSLDNPAGADAKEAQAAAAIARFTAETEIANRKNAEHDEAALASALGREAVSELLLNRQERAAAAKERELKTEERIRAIHASEPMENWAKLDAAAKRDEWNENALARRKEQEDDERALRAAQDALALQQAQNAGHTAEAELLKINADLREKSLEIDRQHAEDPALAKRLKDLAAEDAALQRIIALRKGLHTDKAAQRKQEAQDRKDDRVLELKALNKERSDALKRKHRMTPEEEEDFRKRWKKENAVKTKDRDADGQDREAFFRRSHPHPDAARSRPDDGLHLDDAALAAMHNIRPQAADVAPVAQAMQKTGNDTGAGIDKLTTAVTSFGSKVLGKLEQAFSKISALESKVEATGNSQF